MGFFSAAGAVLGNLFGTPKAAERMVENVSAGIDKLVYTDEEKAEAAAKARTEALAVYNKWLEATSGSRLARRFLALAFTMPWVLEMLLSTCMQTLAPWVSAERAEALRASAETLVQAAMGNNTIIGVILAFYFGGPVAVDALKSALVKWTQRGSRGNGQTD